MHEGTAPPVEPQHQESIRDNCGYFDNQQQMDTGLSSNAATQEYPLENVDNDIGRLSSPAELRPQAESSEDDGSKCRRRPRGSHKQSASAFPVREHLAPHKIAEASPSSAGRTHKKPGPKPFAAKPIAKNDMKAKMEVIRAIERNWGKNFIINYIPKCHRPLQKKKGGKRTAYRQHETDPKKWLPSVLKAVFMVSNHTRDRAFLKKAMNDVVRYRIKHTGNRKPQLVTTDFDVIEDMLVRGWEVDTSFSIRYKHLMMGHPKGQLETDEDIDHILACGDEDLQPGSDEENEETDEDDDDMEIDETVAGDDDDRQPEFSNPYQKKQTYIQGAPHQPPKLLLPVQSKQSKQSKLSKQDKQVKLPKQPEPEPFEHPLPPQHMYGYGPYGGYGMPGYYPPPHMKGYAPPHMKGFPPPPPPMYPWPGYGQYPGYGPQESSKDTGAQYHGYTGYRQQEMKRNLGSQGSRSQDPRAYTDGNLDMQPYPGMQPYPPPMPFSPTMSPSTSAQSSFAYPSSRARFSPFGRSKRSSSYLPEGTPARYGAPDIPVAPRVKREPAVEDHPIAVEDHDDVPTNYMVEADDEPARTNEEEMRNEIEAQERHVMMLKAQFEKVKKRRG
ncbi:hypothetical protein N0V90_004204 [Kalmusia sp. IMI 367209]|nr:hypothetical protein N0V90_004204 [Kalmusia sp. IMI 367209]